jgi:Replication initiation factor
MVGLSIANSQDKSVLPIQYTRLVPDPNYPTSGEPPATNRGLIPQDPKSELIPSVDFLTFTLEAVQKYETLNYRVKIEDWGKTSFVDKPDRGSKHGTWYDSSMMCPFGAKILYRPNLKNLELVDMLVSVPGKICQRMGGSNIYSLIRSIVFRGGRVSRIDINVDDCLRQLNFDDINKCAIAGRYTRFQCVGKIENIISSGLRVGFTFNFGSRQSDTFIRIYDALPVHGVDATRFEIEYKGDNANAIAKEIAKCGNDETATETLGGLLSGSIRFIKENRNHNTSRIQSESWWESFCDRLADARRVTPERIAAVLSNKLQWIRNKCAKSLAIFKAYYGEHFRDEFEAVIKAGFRSFNADTLALLNAAGRERFTRFFDDNNLVIDIQHNPEWWRDWFDDETIALHDAPF